MTSSASVTVQGWWHLDSTQPIADSSGNNRAFGSAFSTRPSTGGLFAANPVNNGAGGPLGTTAYSSTECIQVGVGVGGKRQSAMWGLGYNPPAQNYGIEIWAMPQDNGIAGGSGGWIFSSGQSGGVTLRINAPSDGSPSYIDAVLLGTGLTVGSPAPIDTNRWMHLAIVNVGGVTTFYTNGVPCGPSDTGNATPSAGDAYIGTPNDNSAYFGYLDEARMFTFAAGAFSTNDLLLRPAGPNLIGQPQNAIVWNGGAVTYSVNPSFDNSLLYQWYRGTSVLPGATLPGYYLNTVATADSGGTFKAVVTDLHGKALTSSVATLTVVTPNAANVNAYRSAINAETSLAGYFPVDGDSGSVVVNTKDGSHDGVLENGASFDGRTNTTFGARSLLFNQNGDVQIPNNPAFEFPNGAGTIEFLVSQSAALGSSAFILSENQDGGPGQNYAIGATGDGNNLTFVDDNGDSVSWIVPGGLVGKLTHVALVLNGGYNLTAFVNGANLGTNVLTGGLGGNNAGAPLWIGSQGTSATNNLWAGTVDELAIYTNALSQNIIQQHYSKYFYGTNTAPPSLVSAPASRTILAGASPVLVTKFNGTLPLSYQWTANGTTIPGATGANLALSNVTVTTSYQLTVQNAYGSASTTPIVLTVATPPAGYAATAMADHPTAFWRLSDTSGSTVTDSAGFNDATLSGGYTLGVPAFNGESGTAIQFNGSNGKAVGPLTPVLNPSGPFTIEFWAAPAAYGFYVPVGSMDRPGRTGGYEFYLDGNYPGWEFHTASGGGYSQIDGDNGVPAVGSWNHVVGVYDGTKIIEYVNGALASPDNNGGVTITPDVVTPFYIGARGDNTHYFNGSIADVAFYNYVLSPDRILAHYAVNYLPTTITNQPVGVTAVEGDTITLKVGAKGLPNSYQWQINNGALADASNNDGTAHYPNDVTNSTLTITQATLADAGQYNVVISNPLGGATSLTVRVVVLPDTNKPAVLAATALGTPGPNGGPYLVKLLFNKRLNVNSAGIAANYSFTPAVNILGVSVGSDLAARSLGADWRTVYLQTAGLTPGQKYAVTVSGVMDQAGTPNSTAPTPTYFRAPLLTSGAVAWDYYYLDPGVSTTSGVTPLTGSTIYPNAPETNAYFTSFDSGALTGGDINNNGAFGSLGDNYGDVVSGWITPAVSGAYTFFLAGDDASELDLSTDATPGNLQVIAYDNSCCHGFTEPTNSPAPTYTSQPIDLVAGQSYFIRALHIEGGGGDYVKVAWRLSTDTTVASKLTPIPGMYLSSYQPVPAPYFGVPTVSGGTFRLPWIGYQATVLQSTDLKTWTPVAGNPNPIVVPANNTAHTFYRLVE